ncbi:hypothetical protein KY285_023757 [Solanum tuberosum]|nr:hypothetical protein KY289_024090 [Solanum tuberosum]KAH0675956.1 hypothetical protein KY285_023757 [Solanum tuberosum]
MKKQKSSWSDSELGCGDTILIDRSRCTTAGQSCCSSKPVAKRDKRNSGSFLSSSLRLDFAGERTKEREEKKRGSVAFVCCFHRRGERGRLGWGFTRGRRSSGCTSKEKRSSLAAVVVASPALLIREEAKRGATLVFLGEEERII